MTYRSLLVLMLLALPLFAQTPVPVDSSRTYLPADFAQFAPRTALDMLNRVPGFGIKEEDEERGLGEATGNVVINGQRLSGKSNDVVTELSRIPARNVERIEIVDGATLNDPRTLRPGRERDRPLHRHQRPVGVPAGVPLVLHRPAFHAASRSRSAERKDRSQYTLGLDNRGNRSGAGGPTWIYSPAGTLRGVARRGVARQLRAAAAQRPLRRTTARGTSKGNLNLLYGRLYYDYLETGSRSTVGGTTRDRNVTVDEHGHNYEIGGDYEFGLGRGRLKLIGVGRGSRYPNETTVITRSPPTRDAADRRIASRRSATTGRSIGRAEYRWTTSGAEWQISAEGAFNSLDNASRLFETAAPTAGFEEIPLPGGIASVEEDRYEVMGSYGRPLVDEPDHEAVRRRRVLAARAGRRRRHHAHVLPSERRAVGSVESFAADGRQLQARAPRRAAQLLRLPRFGRRRRTNIENAANPDLVPEQSWDLEVEGVRNLGTLGSTTLRLYGRLIDDIIDYVPIGADGQSPGNLDHATVYGIESRSTLNLDRIGWRGARLDAEVQLQESEVEDPLTGEERHISNSLLRFGSLGRAP